MTSSSISNLFRFGTTAYAGTVVGYSLLLKLTSSSLVNLELISRALCFASEAFRIALTLYRAYAWRRCEGATPLVIASHFHRCSSEGGERSLWLRQGLRTTKQSKSDTLRPIRVFFFFLSATSLKDYQASGSSQLYSALGVRCAPKLSSAWLLADKVLLLADAPRKICSTRHINSVSDI